MPCERTPRRSTADRPFRAGDRLRRSTIGHRDADATRFDMARSRCRETRAARERVQCRRAARRRPSRAHIHDPAMPRGRASATNGSDAIRGLATYPVFLMLEIGKKSQKPTQLVIAPMENSDAVPERALLGVLRLVRHAPSRRDSSEWRIRAVG